MGGTPDQQPEAYREYSPFVHDYHLDTLQNVWLPVAIRIYTEPDVQWWMRERTKNLFGMNTLDASAWINHLQLLGHTRATLITTSEKGHHPDGRRHPHSWSIVDNGELVRWFLNL